MRYVAYILNTLPINILNILPIRRNFIIITCSSFSWHCIEYTNFWLHLTGNKNDFKNIKANITIFSFEAKRWYSNTEDKINFDIHSLDLQELFPLSVRKESCSLDVTEKASLWTLINMKRNVTIYNKSVLEYTLLKRSMFRLVAFKVHLQVEILCSFFKRQGTKTVAATATEIYTSSVKLHFVLESLRHAKENLQYKQALLQDFCVPCGHTVTISTWKGVGARWGLASSPRKQVKNKRKWPQAAPKEVQVGCQKEFIHGKCCQAFEWAAQGGGAVSPLEMFKKWLDMVHDGTCSNW